MCGRFDNLIARDAYRGLFKAQRLPKSNFPLRYNVAPTDQIPIVRIDPRDGEREVVMARWGLIPFWMKEKPKVPHINARAETVHKLPLFREAFAKRRCLIPATGFQGSRKGQLWPATGDQARRPGKTAVGTLDFDECQQVGVHLVLASRAHAVRRALIDLQLGVFDDLGGQER